jgi:DNA invertase Pin-like site-specific DNA recombinase
MVTIHQLTETETAASPYKVGYVWGSTAQQSPQLQIDALQSAGCQKIYQEIASGAKAQRPQLEQMLAQLRSGDVLVVWKLDRLGRSRPHLVRLASQPTETGRYDAEI